MRFKISTKIGAVFSIFLAEVLLLLFTYDIVNQRYEHYVNELEEEIVELKLISQLQIALDQVVMPVNDYLVTGARSHEEENFKALSAKVEGLIAVLDFWGFDEIEEKEVFNNIKEEYLKLKEKSLKIFTIHSPVGNLEAASLMKSADKISSSAVTSLIKFHAFANKEIKKINENQNRIKNQINFIVLLGALFNIALILISLLYFRATISLPITYLKEVALEVGKGNLDKKVNIKLNDEIGELGIGFNEMIEGLKDAQLRLIQAEKMELVGKLASGVAHEVRNPLSVILQGIDYLSQIYGSNDDSCILALNDMGEAVKKADATINGLLDFASTRKLDIKLIDINFIIEKALLLVKYQLEKSNIKVIADYKKDIPNILADKNKIEQAFVNFFTNAIESMPGGGQLKIRTYMEQLTGVLEGSRRIKEDKLKFIEKAVVVEVEDTGSGIPEDILNKIFTPFFTTKGDKGGTGLGLWIVRSIVEMHNGKMKIENKKEDKGVKVTVMFKV